MTRGDQVTARFLHQEYFTYLPTFKLLMATNDKPQVYGTDLGIWRRIRMIPFMENFEGREDALLTDKLAQELPGILNWAVEGCLQWQRQGLRSTPEVQAATQAYQDDMDVLGDFIDECCEVPCARQQALAPSHGKRHVEAIWSYVPDRQGGRVKASVDEG